MQLEDPTRYGWTFEENVWKATFSNQEPVPDIVRQSLSIKCSDKICNNNRCTCIAQGLKCCSECKYANCSNQATVQIFLDSDVEDF